MAALRRTKIATTRSGSVYLGKKANAEIAKRIPAITVATNTNRFRALENISGGRPCAWTTAREKAAAAGSPNTNPNAMMKGACDQGLVHTAVHTTPGSPHSTRGAHVPPTIPYPTTSEMARMRSQNPKTRNGAAFTGG